MRQPLQQRDRERPGGAHPRAGGDVGHRGHLEWVSPPVALEALAQDRMPDRRDVVDVLGLRVLHLVPALEDRVHQHVDVLVDRAGDEEPAVLAVVGGQVGSAPAERDPQGRSAEDDAHRTPASVVDLALPGIRVGVEPLQSPADRLFDREGGTPPERADPRAVEHDQRAVARPSALAAGVVELGLDPHVPADQADRVVDHDGLVGPQVVDPELAGSLLVLGAPRS